MSWIGRKLARLKFVQKAIVTRADLSRFRRRPSRRTAVGLIMAGAGLLLGWPGASLALVLAAVLGEPVLALYVAPGLYIFSWIPYLVGIWIGGPESLRYFRDFNRWLTRITVEKLLGRDPVPLPARVSSGTRMPAVSRVSVSTPVPLAPREPRTDPPSDGSARPP